MSSPFVSVGCSRSPLLFSPSQLTDSSDRLSVELYDFPQPSIFPSNDPHTAYKKVYVDGPSCELMDSSLGAERARADTFAADHRGDGKAYEAYGISKEQGAIVVVRPDQRE